MFFGNLLGIAMLSGIVLIVPLIGVLVLWRVIRGQRRVAKEHGYSSLFEYLRAAPATDAEKRAAADLALKGVVICLLGLISPPVLLVGLFPLFYGARKVMYASMGLGLVDDASR